MNPEPCHYCQKPSVKHEEDGVHLCDRCPVVAPIRAEKIRGNGKCPCLSGRKFKDCCRSFCKPPHEDVYERTPRETESGTIISPEAF